MLGELNNTEIDRLLRTERVARIGCHADGVTYVVPVGYAYDGAAVYFLSAEGRKLTMMRANPKVCFEVEQIQHWTNWKSVIAWGTFEELAGDAAEQACRLLHSTLTPLIEFETRTSAETKSDQALGARAHRFVLYRISIEERTGRYARLE